MFFIEKWIFEAAEVKIGLKCRFPFERAWGPWFKESK